MLPNVGQDGALYEYDYDYRTRRIRRIEDGAISSEVFSAGLAAQEYAEALTWQDTCEAFGVRLPDGRDDATERDRNRPMVGVQLRDRNEVDLRQIPHLACGRALAGRFLVDYFVLLRNTGDMIPVPSHSISSAQVFKALGHPARLTICRELRHGQRCVCELVEKVGLSWSTVSRHLSVLKEAGVVADDKQGLQVFYRLTLPCVSQFIECLENAEKCCER